MDAETLLENFEVIAEAPDGIHHIRELILNLAVGGKLVSQEEAIEVHLRSEIEGPFQLPDSWRWELITSITSDLGQEVPKSEFQYIDVGSINSKSGRISEGITLLNPEDAPSRARKLVKKGTVLYSTVRPYLRNIAIVEKDFNPKAIASTAFAVLHPSDQILSSYLFVCVRSSYFTQFVESKQKGVAYPAINAGDLKMAMIPLPPIAEQKRIIAKVDELMALCDQLEQQQKHRVNLRTATRKSAIDAISTATTPEEIRSAWKRISNNWDVIADTPESVESLRNLIDRLAIGGSLCKSDKSEEAVDVPNLGGLFEVPPSWRWTRIQDVSNFVNGFAFKSEDYNTNGVGIVRMSDLKFGQISVQDMKRVSVEYLVSLDQNFRVVPGDLVIGMSGSIGKPCFNLTNETFLLNQRVGKFVPFSVDKSYLAIVLRTLEATFLELAAGSGIKNLSTKQIKDALLPLPPMAEQKRIVAKVGELLELCDQLEAELKSRNELAEKFARSVVSAA
jgi:type I restriction enzyme S subunit